MSDISSISGSSSLSFLLGAITTSQSQQAQQNDPMQSVATLLGMSNSDVQKAAGHHHHYHSGGGSSSTSGIDALTSALSGQGTNSAADTISNLASALGVDSKTLTQQLQSGDTSDLGSELMTALGGSTTGVQYNGLL